MARHEWIANVTALALVNERSQMLGECGQAERKWKLLGYVKTKWRCGIMHCEHLTLLGRLSGISILTGRVFSCTHRYGLCSSPNPPLLYPSINSFVTGWYRTGSSSRSRLGCCIRASGRHAGGLQPTPAGQHKGIKHLSRYLPPTWLVQPVPPQAHGACPDVQKDRSLRSGPPGLPDNRHAYGATGQ